MVSPGRARNKPSNHCAGKAGLLPLNLYAHVRFAMFILAHETVGAARTRSSLRPLFLGRMILQNSGAACREIEDAHPSVVPANAGTHNPWRGLSRKASATLPKRERTAYGSRRSPGRRKLKGCGFWIASQRHARAASHKIACGTKREVLPVIGFSSSRIDRPQGAWSTSQLPITGYWPENCGSGARA
jgi:hypothetical protein